VLAIAALLCACGGSSSNPVAEPGAVPLSTPPAGQVVAVGNRPEGIAYDPTSAVLAIGIRGPDAVLFLDRDGRLLKRVGIPSAPRHLSFAAPGGPLLVPAEKSGELIELSVPTGDVVEKVRVGRQPHEAAAAGGRAFVTNEFSDTVSVVEAGRVVTDLPGPAQPGGIAATHTHVCVVGVRSHVLQLFDARSLQTLGSAPAGAGPTHVVADGDVCYVVDTAGDSLVGFQTAPSLSLLFKTHLDGRPYGAAVDTERKRLWISETNTNTLAELSLSESGPRLVATFPSVREPNSLAVDAGTGRVYVTGTGDGVIQILDPPA